MKKFIYVLLFFTMFFLIKNVEAASGFASEETVPNMYVKVSNGENTYEGPINIITKDGEYFYSLNPYLSFNYDVNYDEYYCIPETLNITDEQREKINIIAHYGYEYDNHTDIKWYGITQYLIWKELNEEIYFINDEINEYKDEIEELENLVETYYTLPSFANSYNYLDIGLRYEFNDENNVLSNFKITSNNIDAFIEKNKLIIDSTQDDYKTEITFSSKDYDPTPAIIYYMEGYQSLFKKGQKEILNFSVKINVINGKLTIIKKDSENIKANFSDSKYGLYNKDGLVTLIILDNSGVVNIDRLKMGEYYLVELKPTPGYKSDNNIYNIVINSKSPSVTLELYGERLKGHVNITKYYGSQGNYQLEDGAQFELYDSDDNYIGLYTTSNGKIEFDLPYGEYYLLQTNGKQGYNFIEKTDIVITEEKDYNIDLYNEAELYEVNINKYYGEKDNFEPEDGAEFNIYDFEDNLIGTYTTVNGQINLNLPRGDYYLVQTKGKEGYKTVDKQCFYLYFSNPAHVYLYDEKIYTNVILNKYYGEEDNYQLEDGAEFELYDENGNLLNTYNTVNGKILMILPYGRYYLKQIKGKEGYKFIETKEIIINEEKDYVINLYNDKINGNITVYKYYGEEDKYKLESNAEFELYDENNKLLGIYKTTSGKFKLSLPYGKYYLKQIKGKEGYKLIETKEIIINEEKDYVINLYNDKIYGNIIITKYYGEGDNYELEDGAEIKVYNKSKKLLGTYTTSNGIINIKLPYGEYYLTQSKGKEGYNFIEKTEFIINEEKDYIINLYNDKIYGNVIITKYYGEEDNYKLEDGAEFELYDENDNLLNIYSTINGVINMRLPYGKYYIRQTKGTSGYKFVNDTKIEITKEKEYVINLYNKKITKKIQIKKYYGENGKYKLENGAEFELYDENDNLIGIYTTDKGIFKLELDYGNYYLKQIKGIENYKFADIIYISIDDSTINNDIIKVYDEVEEENPIIVDVPNTKKEDNHNSLICIIIGILLVIIGYRKRTID